MSDKWMDIPEGEWENLHSVIFDLLMDSRCDSDHGYCEAYLKDPRSCSHERARTIIEEDFPEWVEW